MRPGTAARQAGRRQDQVRPPYACTTLQARSWAPTMNRYKGAESHPRSSKSRTGALRAEDGHYAEKRRCARERERERERDASATLTRPITGTPSAQDLPITLFPKETTRTPTPISVMTGISPRNPRQKRLKSITETDPNPIYQRRQQNRRLGNLIPRSRTNVNPHPTTTTAQNDLNRRKGWIEHLVKPSGSCAARSRAPARPDHAHAGRHPA
jgi:hypothetical protein